MTSEFTREQKREIESMIDDALHKYKNKIRRLESDVSTLQRDTRQLQSSIN